MNIAKELLINKRDTFTLLGVLVLSLLLEFSGVISTFESKTVDVRFRLRGKRDPHPDIVMVDIADDAVEQFGQWPFPRHIHGMFIDAAARLGAKQILYDIYFSKPGNEDSDAFLGQMALDAGNCYFPIKFFPHKIPDDAGVPNFETTVKRFSFANTPSNSGLFKAEALLDPPLPVISHASRAMGFINTVHDDDGVSRRTPAVMSFNDRLYFQLCLAAYVDLVKADPTKVILNSGHSIKIPNAEVKGKKRDLQIPLDANNNILINWCGTWKDLPHYSFRDILVSYKLIAEGEKPIIPENELKALKGKILIVGHVERGSHDYYPTPFSKQYFLPGLQFNLYNTLLTGEFIRETEFKGRLILIILLAILFVFLFSILPPWARPILFIGVLLGYIESAQLLFNFTGIIVPVIIPTIVFIALFSILSFTRYLQEREIRQYVKQAFKKYVAEDVMEQLLNHPEKLKPGGELKDLTIFFSDIRGFTAMSEKHTPEEVVSVLNEYLEAMTKEIFDFQGTIDKFVGDEIMAYFGAPLYPENHEGRAVHAAVKMHETLSKLQRKWASEGRPILKIGVGINTGEVVMGNIGSEHYMDFTLIGDNVNLGARLCSKAQPGEILISESTYKAVKDHVEVAKAESISVKGKEKPVKVYSIVNYRSDLMAERRAFQRFTFEEPHLTPVSIGDVKFQGALADISAGGSQFISSVQVKKGSPIEFLLELPKKKRHRKLIGRVITCDETKSGQYVCRVTFTGQTIDEQYELSQWVFDLICEHR